MLLISGPPRTWRRASGAPAAALAARRAASASASAISCGSGRESSCVVARSSNRVGSGFQPRVRRRRGSDTVRPSLVVTAIGSAGMYLGNAARRSACAA